MNGRVFVGLKQLQKVYLSSNVCINEDFLGVARTRTVAQVVHSKCWFTENLSEITIYLHERFQKFEIFIENTLAEKKILQNELGAAKAAKNLAEAQISEKNLKLNGEAAARTRLEAELRAAQSAKIQAEAQTTFVQKICEKLDAQQNETCAAKTKELRDNFEFKKIENQELLIENQKINAQINEKNLMIKNLEEKVKFLSNNGQC